MWKHGTVKVVMYNIVYYTYCIIFCHSYISLGVECNVFALQLSETTHFLAILILLVVGN